MLFFEKLESIKKEYKNDCRIRQNGTILFGSDSLLPLYSRHTFFEPLTDEIIEEFLVSDYKFTVPKQYITFLRYTNGISLFTTIRKISGFRIARSTFEIYGIPRTPPFSRPREMEEPFDVRIEDLARHSDVPKTWLKCGSYIKDTDFYVTFDIFIDTNSNRVYSLVKNDNKIVAEWDDLDCCLCNLFDILKYTKIEY